MTEIPLEMITNRQDVILIQYGTSPLIIIIFISVYPDPKNAKECFSNDRAVVSSHCKCTRCSRGVVMAGFLRFEQFRQDSDFVLGLHLQARRSSNARVLYVEAR